MKLPGSWTLPEEIKNRLGQKSAGKQRAMVAEGHLLLVLHQAPKHNEKQRQAIFFWRDPQGKWQSSHGKIGLQPLIKHLQTYDEEVNQLTAQYEQAQQAEDYFQLLENLAPLRLAAQNLHFALQSAREEIPDDRDIIDLRDSAYEIERSLSLLHDNMKNALDYRIAQRAEQQTQISLESVRMSNRLNILVAIFFPLTATSCVFGMNLNNGINPASVLAFWFVLIVSISLGLVVRRWIVTGKI